MKDMKKRVKKRLSVRKRDIWDKYEFPYRFYRRWIEPLRKKERGDKRGI